MMSKKIRILEAVDQPRAAVWDAFSAQAEVTTVRSGEEAYQKLRTSTFDLVLVNLMLNGLDGLALLRRIRQERLCGIVVLTSDFPDFRYAQQGILYGAFDYLLRPLTEDMLRTLLQRVREKLWETTAAPQETWEVLAPYMGTEQLATQFDALAARRAAEAADNVHADIAVRGLYETAVRRTFDTWQWLALYEQEEDYLSIDWLRAGQHMVRDFCRRRLCALSQSLASLYPRTEDEKLNAILQYMLTHVDDGCRQKDIAAAHYLSNPSLSELFRKRLGVTYHAVSSEMKLRRAQYLLRYSSMKVYEISARLGYKDVDYFSRKFRARYGMPLSRYRQQSRIGEPETPDYQI